MSRKASSPGYLEQAPRKARLLSMLGVEGLSDAEAARRLSTKAAPVSRQRVNAFRRRHAAELAPVVRQAEQAVIDVALSEKSQSSLVMQRPTTLREAASMTKGSATLTHRACGSVGAP